MTENKKVKAFVFYRKKSNYPKKLAMLPETNTFFLSDKKQNYPLLG